MESAAGGGGSSSTLSGTPGVEQRPAKFSVYQNPALSAALSARSLQPSRAAYFVFCVLSSASAYGLIFMTSREAEMINTLGIYKLPRDAAFLLSKIVKSIMGLVLVGSLSGFFKAVFSRRSKVSIGVSALSISKCEGKNNSYLTNRQLELLGLQSRVESGVSEVSKKPPKSKTHVAASDILVPIHAPSASPNSKSQVKFDKSNSSMGQMRASVGTSLKGHSSPLLSAVSSYSSPMISFQPPPSLESSVSPWSSKQGSASRDISTEEQLERFLAEVDEKLVESAGKHLTPSPTIREFDITTPNAVTPVRNSGTSRSIPLRPVRMSPGSQKFTTPPKKGDNDLSPMSMEESVEAFKNLGIYPQIEQWRDRLRQWFSAVLLKPLVRKIDKSHIQVIQTAAKLGISITVNKVGTSDLTKSQIPGSLPASERKEWQPAFSLDEDGLLHQIRATLLQAIDASTSRSSIMGMQQSPQQNPSIPVMQECVDAITEHQRLRALMKGEWAKGLLPHSSLPEEYMVQRVQDLAEGTCLKNYNYKGNVDVYDKTNKNWTLEPPTDSHILLYLFFAYLEHPKWMLHVDPALHAVTQASKNPLFLGVLPPKEQFPEKCIAAISSVPSTVHPGACILVSGKQYPPVFGLYWDKKLQFSLQGRNALWDSILLLCHRIKTGYGGVIRGVHLGSSALSLLPIFESDNDPE